MKQTFSIDLADSGFCGGVHRADVSIQKIREEEEGPLYIYGELIHNSFYNDNLKTQNIHILDSLIDAKDKIVLIRTHGISPQEEKELYIRATKVFDLTCPLVKSIQKKALQLSEEGYFVIITGNPIHPEVLGIKGYASKHAIVESIEDLKPILDQENKKLAILSQSTFSQDTFLEIVEYLENHHIDIKIVNTLCGATTQRQDNAEIYAKHYDMVIVIGGKNSSNTKKVFQKAYKESITKQVFHIEQYNELKNYDFSTIRSVIISSGTSTPVFLIQELLVFLKERGGVFKTSVEKLL